MCFFDKKQNKTKNNKHYKRDGVYDMSYKVTKERVHRLLFFFPPRGPERAAEAGSRRPEEAAEPTGDGARAEGGGRGRRKQGRGEIEEGDKAVERRPDTLGGGLTAGSCAQE